MLKKYIQRLEDEKEVYLKIKGRPNANKTEIKQIMKNDCEDIIKVDIAAPPLKGKANQELITILAKEFNINKENIKIISGAGDKIKLIRIKAHNA